ncbi:hypothetical protein V6N12_009040 [Hibiscus sabdariffa]|uniref:Uncharacterized protein n=1 Tax=Hibiscus sabdariffa TaxID=183260 RepID=A0ABR2C584_9ROSI
MGQTVMMDQEIMGGGATTVGYAGNRRLTEEPLMMCSLQILLPPEFQNFPMRIRMLRRHKCRTRRGSCEHFRPDHSLFEMGWTTRDDQSQGGARERFDRAFAGCGISSNRVEEEEEEDSGVAKI